MYYTEAFNIVITELENIKEKVENEYGRPLEQYYIIVRIFNDL